MKNLLPYYNQCNTAYEIWKAIFTTIMSVKSSQIDFIWQGKKIDPLNSTSRIHNQDSNRALALLLLLINIFHDSRINPHLPLAQNCTISTEYFKIVRGSSLVHGCMHG